MRPSIYGPVRRVGARWTTSPRSAAPEEAAKVRRDVSAEQPSFKVAVVADARTAARFRGEHHEFSSSLDALVQVLRLVWVMDSFFAQVCYRAEVSCRSRHVPVLPTLLHHLSIATGQVSIGPLAVLRPGVYLPHGQVVIDGLTMVSEGVVLRPFVTLGLKDGHPIGPWIEPRARIGTGAKVFGPVRVGADAQVGANAVVNCDVPARRVAVGVPARVRSR